MVSVMREAPSCAAPRIGPPLRGEHAEIGRFRLAAALARANSRYSFSMRSISAMSPPIAAGVFVGLHHRELQLEPGQGVSSDRG